MGEEHIIEPITATTPKTQNRLVRVAYIAMALALASVLLYLSVRGIALVQVWAILRRASFSYLAACCLLSTIALFLRAFRWRILLRAEAHVSVGAAFWATAAGYFGNNFLPARAGELVRTMMISSRSGLSRAYVLTTALSERLVDAIALVTISAIVLLTITYRPGWFAQAAKPFAILGLAGVLGIAVLPYLERWCQLVMRSLPIPERIRQPLTHILEQTLLGIRSFHHLGRLSGFLGLTTVIWTIDALGTVIGCRALGISMPLPIAFLLIAGLGLGSALPSTPGYIGIYQFVAVNVMTPFGISRTNAVAYILMFQALAYGVITFWGVLALWQYRRKSDATRDLQGAQSF